MRLPAIGRFENIEEIDLEPISVPLIAYTADREEVEQVFRFRPAQPAGATMDILMATRPDGTVPIPVIMQFLLDSLLDEDRAAWNEFLHRPDLVIEQAVLGQLYKQIAEVYAARPTPRWSDSGGGGKPAGPASRAAARSKASRSKTKT